MNNIPHSWDLTPSDAIALQRELVGQVDTQTPVDFENLHLVAGVDVSVKDGVSQAAIVVLSFPDLVVVEAVTARMSTTFPYIPGLLGFREGAVILEAYQKLRNRADAYIFDGQGIAHPRRFGIASHIGLWLDAPTVGCGKTWLCGQYEEVGEEKGSYSVLRLQGEEIGAVLRTRTGVKPVYTSPGHRATLDTARELVLRCATRYRLPEPIRAAHNTAGGQAPDIGRQV
ncbi:MAG: deoxyribonuclease V [Anaerolineae bacterium]|nr:deoxyribonuclease V [Anaerolineae bacterium]